MNTKYFINDWKFERDIKTYIGRVWINSKNWKKNPADLHFDSMGKQDNCLWDGNLVHNTSCSFIDMYLSQPIIYKTTLDQKDLSLGRSLLLFIQVCEKITIKLWMFSLQP